MAVNGGSRLSAAKPRRDPNLEQRVRLARFKHAETRIERIVAAWPPLTDEQRQALAMLLWPDGGQ